MSVAVQDAWLDWHSICDLRSTDGRAARWRRHVRTGDFLGRSLLQQTLNGRCVEINLPQKNQRIAWSEEEICVHARILWKRNPHTTSVRVIQGSSGRLQLSRTFHGTLLGGLAICIEGFGVKSLRATQPTSFNVVKAELPCRCQIYPVLLQTINILLRFLSQVRL